jgi:Transposase
MCHKVVVDVATTNEGAPAMKITTIGLDIAKSVFQVHGVDEDGVSVVIKRLHRKQMLPFFSKLPSCLIGIEACATAHHWARELVSLGHEVKLMPPAYVKAYLKRGKSDALDAEAICEAVQRPTMRFVPVKSPDQQAILMVHRTADRKAGPESIQRGSPVIIIHLQRHRQHSLIRWLLMNQTMKTGGIPKSGVSQFVHTA